MAAFAGKKQHLAPFAVLTFPSLLADERTAKRRNNAYQPARRLQMIENMRLAGDEFPPDGKCGHCQRAEHCQTDQRSDHRQSRQQFFIFGSLLAAGKDWRTDTGLWNGGRSGTARWRQPAYRADDGEARCAGTFHFYEQDWPTRQSSGSSAAILQRMLLNSRPIPPPMNIPG